MANTNEEFVSRRNPSHSKLTATPGLKSRSGSV